MQTLTILIVEDDDGWRKFISEVLSESGYGILEARDGEEAFNIFEKHHAQIDLLFTDVIMPKLDGVTLAERLNALNPSLKVIFSSGYGNGKKLPSSRSEEVHFLEKPYEPADLLEKIASVLQAQ